MLKEAVRRHVGLKVALATIVFTSVLLGLFTLAISQINADLITPRQIWILFALVITFCVFFQFVLITLMVNTLIDRPLSKLYQAMQRVKEGNLTVKCEVITEDEFRDVAQCFNDMLVGLNDMNEKRKTIEKKLIQTEESLKYKLELENKARIIKRMNEELTDAFNNTALLYSVSQFLNSVIDLKELTTTAQNILEEKFRCDQLILALQNPKSTGGISIVAHRGIKINPEDLNITLGAGLMGNTVLKKRIYYIDDISKKGSFHHVLTAAETGLKGTLMSLPLIVRNQVVGIIVATREVLQGFSPADRQSLEAIVNQIAIAYDRSNLYTKTRELSVTDELTGLFNRRHFQQVLTLEFKRAERYKRHLSLLMIDADHFKQFNDTHGHLAGDEMLKRMATLLRKNLREVDLLARYGGEEFIVMLTDTSLTDAVTVADKLRELVKSNLRMDSVKPNEKNLTISLGVSAYPDCATSIDELIHTADMALYTSKSRGRDQVHAYKPSLPLEELMVRGGRNH